MSIFEKYGDWHIEFVEPMDKRHTNMMHSSPTLNEFKEELYQSFKERYDKEQELKIRMQMAKVTAQSIFEDEDFNDPS